MAKKKKTETTVTEGSFQLTIPIPYLTAVLHSASEFVEVHRKSEGVEVVAHPFFAVLSKEITTDAPFDNFTVLLEEKSISALLKLLKQRTASLESITLTFLPKEGKLKLRVGSTNVRLVASVTEIPAAEKSSSPTIALSVPVSIFDRINAMLIPGGYFNVYYLYNPKVAWFCSTNSHCTYAFCEVPSDSIIDLPARCFYGLGSEFQRMLSTLTPLVGVVGVESIWFNCYESENGSTEGMEVLCITPAGDRVVYRLRSLEEREQKKIYELCRDLLKTSSTFEAIFSLPTFFSFVDALKRASTVVKNDIAPAVDVSISNDRIKVQCESSQVGEGEVEADLFFEGDRVSSSYNQCFNTNYLLLFLRQMKKFIVASDYVEISLRNRLTMIYLKEDGVAGIIAPITKS